MSVERSRRRSKNAPMMNNQMLLILVGVLSAVLVVLLVICGSITEPVVPDAGDTQMNSSASSNAESLPGNVDSQPPSSSVVTRPSTVPPTTAPVLPVTPSGGNYINVGSGYIAEVVQANVETFTGTTVDDYSHPTNNYLPEGTVDYCKKDFVYGSTKYVLLRSGHRVYFEKKVYPFETEPVSRQVAEVKQYAGTLPDHNEIGVVSLQTDGHHTILTLDTMWKAPFYFETNQSGYANPNGGKDRDYAVNKNNATYVDITFCYATVLEGNVSIPAGHPLFKSAEVIKNESDYTLRLHLRKAGSLYGWHAYYNENDQLCFQFLNPAKATAADNKYGADLSGVMVMIDVGHGGIDGGAVAYRCPECKLSWPDKKKLTNKKYCPTCNKEVELLEEADLNLSLANAIKKELESIGANVIFNRYDDSAININNRLRNLMNTSPDVCVAVHQNSYSSAKVGGFDSMYFTPWSQLLAKNIYEYTKESSVYTKTWLKWSVNYFMMRQTVCPTILTENGYMSNPDDLNAMVDPVALENKAIAIAHGIADYFLDINK